MALLGVLWSSLGKYLLMALAVVAILFGVYMWGHSSGSAAGYKQAWDAQQVTINKMVTDANTKTEAHNNQITQLEYSGAKQAAATDTQIAGVTHTREQIIADYVKAHPQKSVKVTSKTGVVTQQLVQDCGLSLDSVLAVNAIILADPTNTPPAALAPASPPDSASSVPVAPIPASTPGAAQ